LALDDYWPGSLNVRATPFFHHFSGGKLDFQNQNKLDAHFAVNILLLETKDIISCIKNGAGVMEK